MPTLSAEFSVDGVDDNEIAHEVAYGAIVTLALLSTTGAQTINWSINGVSHASMTAPVITPGGSPTGATATFAMPADPSDDEGRAVTVKAIVTDARNAQAVAYRVVGVPNVRGEVPGTAGEELARHPTMGWLPLFNRAIARTGQAYVDARDFATGDGTTDDSDALLAALAAASAASTATTRSVPVVGGGKVYGIAGNFQLPDGANFQDIEFKQLTPAMVADPPDGVRTLEATDVDNIRLVRVTVDRNGDGTQGAINYDAGIWIDGGEGHYFEDVEVFGDDGGTGFQVWNAENFSALRVHVHDINYDLGAEPGDDTVQGIWFRNCSNFSATDCSVQDLGGDFPATPSPNLYSRGMALGGNTEFTIVNFRGRFLDQGLDITGSDGNTRFTIIGGEVSDCFSVGWKCANSAQDGTLNGCISIRCGQAGFIFSGPGEAGLAVKTSDITVVGCVAYDTGEDYWLASQNVAGFRIINSDFDPETCTGITLINCRAIDRRVSPKMEYGFHNAVTGENSVVNCLSSGHTVEAVGGTWRSIQLGNAEFGSNVLSYGATRTGTGETDDTAAIQACITAVGSVGGGTVFVPRGVYRFTSLTVGSADVALQGEAGTILETTSTTANVIALQGARSGARSIHVRTVGIPSTGCHFRLTGADVFLDKCTITNAFDGVLATNNAGVRIENCRVVSTVHHAVQIGDTGESCTAPVITGNTIESAGANAFAILDSTDALVSGNQIKDSTGDCIVLGAATRPRVIGNLVAGSSDDGISVVAAVDPLIEGNTIQGNTDIAIDVAAATSGAIVRNNRCTGNGTNGPVVPTYTIATGALTLKGDFGIPAVIDTEAAAATDDLDTISGGLLGQTVTLRAANDARTIVVKDSTGNMRLSADMSLTHTDDAITLVYDGTIWREVGRCDATA